MMLLQDQHQTECVRRVLASWKPPVSLSKNLPTAERVNTLEYTLEVPVNHWAAEEDSKTSLRIRNLVTCLSFATGLHEMGILSYSYRSFVTPIEIRKTSTHCSWRF